MTPARRAQVFESIATWTVRLLIVVLTGISAQMLSAWSDLGAQVDSNTTRIEVIEATRFTADMGHKMEDRIIKSMDARFPQEWLRQAVERTEAGVTANGAKLDALKERVIRLEERGNTP